MPTEKNSYTSVSIDALSGDTIVTPMYSTAPRLGFVVLRVKRRTSSFGMLSPVVPPLIRDLSLEVRRNTVCVTLSIETS